MAVQGCERTQLVRFAPLSIHAALFFGLLAEKNRKKEQEMPALNRQRKFKAIGLRVPIKMGEAIERIASRENNPISTVCRRMLAEAIRQRAAALDPDQLTGVLAGHGPEAT